MKFYYVLMFIILFNISIGVVDTLNIYNLEGQVSDDYNVMDKDASGHSPLYKTFYTIISSIMAGIVTATIVTYFTKSLSDAAIAYAIMTALYVGAAMTAVGAIENLANNNTGFLIVVNIFKVMLLLVWIFGLIQMVRGGMRGYV
jgi:hypothetical protein